MNTSSTTATAPVTPARPGRPTTWSQQIVDLLCAIIRSNGISDSGAAALARVHPSTVSRWKREHPDLVIALLQAREQFRDHHLSLIMRASEAKGGWRAAAWLLERVFPADYHPKAAERERFQKLQDGKTRRWKPPKPPWSVSPTRIRRQARHVEAGAAEAGHPEPVLHNSQNAAGGASLTPATTTGRLHSRSTTDNRCVFPGRRCAIPEMLSLIDGHPS